MSPLRATMNPKLKYFTPVCSAISDKLGGGHPVASTNGEKYCSPQSEIPKPWSISVSPSPQKIVIVIGLLDVQISSRS